MTNEDTIVIPSSLCLACGERMILSVGDEYMCGSRYLSPHGQERSKAVVEEMWKIRDANPDLQEPTRRNGEELLKRALEKVEMIQDSVAKHLGKEIDKSHRFKRWYTDVRAVTSTPRFYSVHQCKNCGAEEIKHPAGHFIDEALFQKCE